MGSHLGGGGTATRVFCIQGVCIQGGSASRGRARMVCIQGRACIGGTASRGVCIQGESTWKRVGQTPRTLQDTVNKRALCILLENILVFGFFIFIMINSWVFPKCFPKFAEFSDKNIFHYSKRARTCHTATCYVIDQNPTTVPVRHMWETGSLKCLCFSDLSDPLNSLNSCFNQGKLLYRFP